MDVSENVELEKLSPLEHLALLRDTWSDEIPENVIDSMSKIKAKVRTSWFQNVIAAADIALDMGDIKTPEGKTAVEQLESCFTSEEFKQRQLTKPEDIQEANRLIDIILGRQGTLRSGEKTS